MSEISRLRQRIETIKQTGNPVPGLLEMRLRELTEPVRDKRAQKKKRDKRIKWAKRTGQWKPKKSFWQSAEWRELRYSILVERGARCECCGVTPKEGAVMNVDHIKPISKAPHLKLERTNLQVLCAKCNHGKGSHDETDWRG